MKKIRCSLVELIRLDPTIQLDVRYATNQNFVGRAVYSEPRVFLQPKVAEILVQAHQSLKTRGLGLSVFDGYRPWSVTKIFWDVTEPPKRHFVADPEKGSVHNRGAAVDLTLFDLKSGKQVEMPSDFDEMTERSYLSYTGGSELGRQYRDELQSVMRKVGFTGYEYEWWHFNAPDWQTYEILDLSFSELDVS